MTEIVGKDQSERSNPDVEKGVMNAGIEEEVYLSSCQPTEGIAISMTDEIRNTNITATGMV